MSFLLKMCVFVLPLWAYVLVGFCPRGFCPRGGTCRQNSCKIFSKGAWPSSRDPVNCMAFSANSYKVVEAIPYTDFKCVSVPIKHV